MKEPVSQLIVRDWRPEDIEDLRTLLNDVIRIGGTTAHQTPFSTSRFSAHFLDSENHLSCYVAIGGASGIAGFQTLHHHPDLPDDWADIATFARPSPKVPGVGTALFAQTRLAARTAINATIRADNEPGLAFYTKMGFETYAVLPDIPLADDSRVDRIRKRYICAPSSLPDDL